MSVKTQIPEVEGVADEKAKKVLAALKSILDSISGRAPNRPQIVKLGGSANLSGVINKVNEIIERLQG